MQKNQENITRKTKNIEKKRKKIDLRMLNLTRKKKQNKAKITIGLNQNIGRRKENMLVIIKKHTKTTDFDYFKRKLFLKQSFFIEIFIFLYIEVLKKPKKTLYINTYQ